MPSIAIAVAAIMGIIDFIPSLFFTEKNDLPYTVDCIITCQHVRDGPISFGLWQRKSFLSNEFIFFLHFFSHQIILLKTLILQSYHECCDFD